MTLRNFGADSEGLARPEIVARTIEQISSPLTLPNIAKQKDRQGRDGSFVSNPHGTTLDDAQFSKLSQLSLQGQMKWIYANHSVNWNSKFPCTSFWPLALPAVC